MTITDTNLRPLPAQTATPVTSAVGTRLSVTDTSSATLTGVSSDPTTSFTFETMPSSMDTCVSTTVGWDYVGPDCNITLLVSFTVFPTPGGVVSTILGVEIGQDVDAASDEFLWSPVNLAAGRYILRATGPNIAAESSIFTIVNGADTSCLSGVSAPSPVSTAKPVSGIIETSSITESLMPSGTPTPPPAPSPTHYSHAGAIAGGIFGGIGVLAAILVAGAYLRTRHVRPLRRAGEREREKTSGARVEDVNLERYPSQPVYEVTSIAPTGERPRMKPNCHQSSFASSLEAPKHPAYVEGETLSREPTVVTPTPPAAGSKLGPQPDPFADGLSVSSNMRSYRTSVSNTSGVGLLGSPAPSSATSQMYRGRDSAGSVWTYWRSLRGDRESRVLNGTSPAHSLEDLSTMPPLQIAEGATFPDGC